MSNDLEYHKGSVSNVGRIFINFHFADDIAVGVGEEEAGDIVTTIDTTSLAIIRRSIAKATQKPSSMQLFSLFLKKKTAEKLQVISNLRKSCIYFLNSC